MTTFGKRTMNMADSPPRRHASGVPRQTAPILPDSISKADLKALEKGAAPCLDEHEPDEADRPCPVRVACALGATVYYGTGVVRDLRYAGTYSVAFDLRATEGTLQALYVPGDGLHRQDHSMGRDQPETTAFLMFFRSGDGADLIPVRSSLDASAIGVRYAVEGVLLNRTLSLLAITLFFGWLAWTLLNNVRKGRYKDGPAYEALKQYVAQHPSPA